MIKHTPGPWHWLGEDEEHTQRGFLDGPLLVNAANQPVLSIELYWSLEPGEGLDGKAIKVSEADARLIAAAPDLLAALQAILAITDRKHTAWDEARAAIAKATGDSA